MTQRIMHFRLSGDGEGDNPRGGLTVAIIVVPDGDGIMLNVGLAFCSPRDQFNRRKGAAIALGRAGGAASAIRTGLLSPLTGELRQALAERAQLRAWSPTVCQWSVGSWNSVCNRIVAAAALTMEQSVIQLHQEPMRRMLDALRPAVQQLARGMDLLRKMFVASPVSQVFTTVRGEAPAGAVPDTPCPPDSTLPGLGD